MGFAVRGWSRTTKAIEGVATFAGPEGLAAFLAGTAILVCLLPLTPATRGILDARPVRAACPRGRALINLGRGAHLVEQDLLDALDRGHLAHASLDCFADEPLPPGHPFWRHPRIDVTPHVASFALPGERRRGVFGQSAPPGAGPAPCATWSTAARGY